MEMRQLTYLVAIAEEASFSRAAARVGIAQPSLSQQIRKLEEEVGASLLDRLPRRVVPTAAGERLLAHARRVLSEVADAKRGVAECNGSVSGTLCVGAIPTIAPFLLPRVLKRYTQAFPDVRLRVTEDVSARLIALLEAGEIDVAVTSVLHGPGSVHVECIATEPLLLMLPKQHPLAARKAVPWQSIADERFLVLQEMHCLSGQVSWFCRKREVNPSVVMQGAQLSTIAAMVSAGMGVSVVPRMMCDAVPPDGVVYRPFPAPAPEREICLAWSLLRYRTNAAREFERALRATLPGVSTGNVTPAGTLPPSCTPTRRAAGGSRRG